MNDASHPPRKWVFALVALALGGAACGTAETVDTTASAEAPSAATSSETTGPSQISPTTTAPAADEPFATVEAGNGVVEIPKRPTAIVSLSPTATEMLFAIGAGDRVIAVDPFSDFPPEAPVSDLDGFSPSVEAIAERQPDLVVLAFDPGDVVAGLEALGIETVVQDAAATLDDAYAQITELGEVTGQGDGAAALVASIRERLDELASGAPSAAGLTYYHELDTTLFTVTGSTFAGAIYGLFGLVNVADGADADGSAFGYPQLSEEYLVDADPDLVFLADTICCEQTAATVARRPGWDQLTAVRNGAVFELSDDIASRWGPRIVDFAEAIADALEEVAGS